MVAMMTRWDKLKDDRGEPSDICSIRNAIKESGYAKEFLIRRDETGRFWSTALILGFIFASIMHLFFWIWINKGAGPFVTPMSTGIFVFQFVFYGGSMGVMTKLYGWRSSSHAKSAMLRAGLCPGCGYQIHDVHPEEDGCSVCPECGGAWRVGSDG